MSKDNNRPQQVGIPKNYTEKKKEEEVIEEVKKEEAKPSNQLKPQNPIFEDAKVNRTVEQPAKEAKVGVVRQQLMELDARRGKVMTREDNGRIFRDLTVIITNVFRSQDYLQFRMNWLDVLNHFNKNKEIYNDTKVFIGSEYYELGPESLKAVSHAIVMAMASADPQKRNMKAMRVNPETVIDSISFLTPMARTYITQFYNV